LGIIYFHFLAIIVFSSTLQAFELVSILDVSSSGRSLILDRGSLEGVELGEFARFVLQQGDLENPNLSNVALGEAIKVESNQSVWYLHEVDNKSKIKGGQRVLYARAKDILEGRRPFKTLNKVVISGEEDLLSQKMDESTEEPGMDSKFIQNEENFGVELEDGELVKREESDLEKVSFENRDEGKKKDKKLPEKYVEAARQELKEVQVDLKQADKKEGVDQIKEREVLNQLNSNVDQNIAKVNKQRFGLKGLYNDQKRDEQMRWLGGKSFERSTYDQVRDEKKVSEVIDPRSIKKAEQQGDFWSADMSDEQLRRYFVTSGLAKEVERRKLGLENREGNEILVRYTQGLMENHTSDDPNFQSLYGSFDISYEYHLMRTTKTLQNWSVNIGYLKGLGNYDVGGVNARAEETSYRLGLQYYFYNLPSTIRAYTWYVGSAMKMGSSNISSTSLSQEYKYQMVGFEYAQLGFKYRFYSGDDYDEFFNIGVGMTGQISLETTQNRSKEFLADDIDGTFSTNDLKFALGISVIF